MMKFLTLFYLFCFLGSSFNTKAEEPKFSFLLASTFDPKKHLLGDYYLSEKLDGVRAYWNGNHLRSRGGKKLAAPQWFLESLPDTPMDGELWGGRQTFDKVSGIVRRSQPHEGWRNIVFMVFELPKVEDDFTMRYQQMQQLYSQFGNQYWQVVEQIEPPETLESLQAMLEQLDANGGEGFMLKSKSATYRGGRSDGLLKLKLRNDAEARVVAHLKGKGRLANVMGSILVEMPNGIRFKIGSGFSDAQRHNPPPTGSLVTYKYNGLTKNGKPRFPVFWRVRN